MATHRVDCEVVTDEHTLTFGELCRSCGVGADWVRYLVDEGVLHAETQQVPGSWVFYVGQLPRAHAAKRLSSDPGLNAAGIALALDLIEENRELRRLLAERQDAQ